ncbi:MAG: sulfurtransferase TusA family protein [Parvularculaceae bacterium]
MSDDAADPPTARAGTDIVEIDARGLRCPMPVVKLEAALRRLGPAARVRILADDPVAPVDIPHASLEAGCIAERLPDAGGACVFLVTRGPGSD